MKPEFPIHDLTRIVSELAQTICPYAVRCRLLIDVMDGDEILTNTFHIPLTMSEEASLDNRILDVFNRTRLGEWIQAKTIARELDLAAFGGHLKRTLSAMVKSGKLESNRALGYRRPPAVTLSA